MFTVVVADDEEELRRALIRKVNWEEVGFKVVGEAENGAEALEMVEKYEPDLLLTDISMPYVSGIELARQVREIRPMTQIAFLSGFDDFAYAQQAIQYNIISYLLKPISAAELTVELGNIRKKMEEKYTEFMAQNQEHVEIDTFLLPLMLDTAHVEMTEEREERIIREALQCGLLRDQNNNFRYTVMVTSIQDDEGRNCTTRATVNAIDIILRKYMRHASFYADGKVVSLLMATPTGYDKYLHIIVEDIAQSVKRIMDKTSMIGVSRQITKLVHVHEAYIEAMNALAYSKKKGNNVHFIFDVERTEEPEYETLQGYISEIENQVRGGTKEDVENCINSVFDWLESENIYPMTVNFMMGHVTSEVFRMVYAIADEDAIRELQKHLPVQNPLTNSLSDLRTFYLDFCVTAKQIILEQRKKSGSVICDRAIELIEREYMNPELSLVMISSEISVSPNYLSALIKKSTGHNFIDLLTEKRINKAKELLLGSTMKVREVSETCGYNDQHYFSYCFKKITGVSPNSCRHTNAE